MKFKRITAALLSVMTLAAMPAVPVLRDVLPDTAVTAEAADTYVRQFTVNNVYYKVYRDKNAVEYAVVTGSASSVTRLKLTASVTHNNVSYPIRKIGASAFANRTNIVEMNLSEVSGLVEIGENAFKDSSVRYVEIGGNGTNLTIGKGAFQNTKKLDYVYVYSGVNHLMVEKNAFYSSAITDFSCYAKSFSAKSESFSYAGYSENGDTSLNLYIYSCTDSATLHEKSFMGAGIANLSVYCRSITINKCAFIDSNDSRRYARLSGVYFGAGTSIIHFGARAFAGLPHLKTVTFRNPNATLTMNKETFSGSTLETINLPDTLKTIPEKCFNGCRELKCNPITPNITTIGAGAFRGATLPQTVSIGTNTTQIADDAFTYTTGIKAFSVPAGNTKFKSDNGVLVSKDGSRLLCYPQLKTSSSYTSTASTIPDGAFYENTYLKTLSIAKLFRGGTDRVDYFGLKNLENLTIPAMDYNSSPELFLSKFDTLFRGTKVHKLNGSEIVVTPSGKEPYFNSKFSDFMKNHFEDYEQYGFLQRYVDKMATYIVNKETTPSMNDMEKAVKLHEWLMNYVEYDPLVSQANEMRRNGITPPADMESAKNHVDASAFLHVRNGHHYTVCDGYARCYKILLRKAGVTAYYVHGNDTAHSFENQINHAWNLVQINGNYYHVDVTWDDGKTGRNRFQNFMKHDGSFGTDGHKVYDWSVWNKGAYDSYDPEDEISDLDKKHGVADYNLDNLGRIGKTPSIDQSCVDRLQQRIANHAAYSQSLDINFDGQLTSADVTLLQKYVNKGSSYRGYGLAEWVFEQMLLN